MLDLSGFFQVLRGLGPVRLAAIGAVMLGVVGFFGYLMSQTSQGTQSLLFSQLDPADGAKIVRKIESMSIPVTISPDGTSIFVPSDKVARLRMEMAEDGLPGGGSIGYEIFDRGDVLSTSGSLVDINRVRALEGELSKSIKSIAGVSGARVHLVLPKRELFSREKTDPSASIVLKMKGFGKLSSTQVQAIQHLVASAVPGLPTDRISIIDDKGNLLAKSHDNDGYQGLNQQQEIRHAYEANTGKQLESLLEKTVGLGKVRVEVSADIDFNQSTSNTEKYDPEGQVIRSTTTNQDDTSSEGTDGATSVQNELPQEGAQGSKNKNSNKRNEENVHYEISRIVENHKKEAGEIKSLSVAVLVDGVYTKGKDGKSTYAPRSKEDLDKIKTLVKTAIGFKEDRKDTVEIINMPFAAADIDEVKDEETKGYMPEMDFTRIIELLVLSAVGILILIMIIRPILLRVIESSGVAENDPQAAHLLASAVNGYSMGAIPDFSGGMPSTNSQFLSPTDYAVSNDEAEDDTMLDISAVEGRVKASSLKKISDIIDKHPEEAVTIIRNWMYNESWK